MSIRRARPAKTEFLGAQFDLGLAWVSFPPGLGGLGVSVSLQKHVNERLAAAGAPNAFMGNPLGYGMGGPTLLEHGTPEQHQRYLRPLFTHEEIWCQLFSEPGAGSDLAGLATRAERDGDDWVVNGQKVWTSWGHVARWGMLVARTDPQAVKHRGLTYFLCDMRAPGVEVRPLRQMTGNAEFNEVYFSDVRLADALRLGPVGGGWGVALTTLNNERYMLSEGLSAVPALHRAIELWNRRARQDLGAGEGAAGRTARALRRDRGQPPHHDARRRGPLARRRRTGGIGREAVHRSAEQEDHVACRRPHGRRRDAARFLRHPRHPRRRVRRVRRTGPRIPARAGQHHRGRHVGDPAQHPGRTGARTARPTSGWTRTRPGSRAAARSVRRNPAGLHTEIEQLGADRGVSSRTALLSRMCLRQKASARSASRASM